MGSISWPKNDSFEDFYKLSITLMCLHYLDDTKNNLHHSKKVAKY